MSKQQITQEQVAQLLEENVAKLEQVVKALEARERRIRKREQELGLADPNANANRQTEEAVRNAKQVPMDGTTTTIKPVDIPKTTTADKLPDHFIVPAQKHERDTLIVKLAGAGYVIADEHDTGGNIVQLTFRKAKV
jgi:TolA-binding protein